MSVYQSAFPYPPSRFQTVQPKEPNGKAVKVWISESENHATYAVLCRRDADGTFTID